MRSHTVNVWSRAVGCAAVAGAAVATLVFTWDDLPDRVATRWNLHEIADGSLDKTAVLAIAVGLAILAVGGPVAAALHPSGGAPLSVFLGYLLAGIDLSFVLVVVAANHGEASWEGTEAPSALLIGMIIGSVVLASIGARGVPATVQRRVLHPHLPLPLDRADLSASNHGVAAVALILALLTVVAAPDSWWLAAGIALLAMVFALLAHVDVSVDRHGVDVRLSPWRFPRWRIDIKRVEAASVVRSPARLSVGQDTALVIRSGPCLRCELVGGRSLLLGVDDPERAVEVIDEMVSVLHG